jgi:hypothetical protein
MSACAPVMYVRVTMRVCVGGVFVPDPMPLLVSHEKRIDPMGAPSAKTILDPLVANALHRR